MISEKASELLIRLNIVKTQGLVGLQELKAAEQTKDVLLLIQEIESILEDTEEEIKRIKSCAQ